MWGMHLHMTRLITPWSTHATWVENKHADVTTSLQNQAQIVARLTQ